MNELSAWPNLFDEPEWLERVLMDEHECVYVAYRKRRESVLVKYHPEHGLEWRLRFPEAAVFRRLCFAENGDILVLSEGGRLQVRPDGRLAARRSEKGTSGPSKNLSTDANGLLARSG